MRSALGLLVAAAASLVWSHAGACTLATWSLDQVRAENDVVAVARVSSVRPAEHGGEGVATARVTDVLKGGRAPSRIEFVWEQRFDEEGHFCDTGFRPEVGEDYLIGLKRDRGELRVNFVRSVESVRD